MADAGVTIIGGGAVGLAIASELADFIDNVVLLDKNTKVTDDNQTTRNSGVIHSGIYYDSRKVPLKASKCVEGNRLLYEFCEKKKVPHKQVGKFVVASSEMEIPYIEDTLRIAIENKVPDVKLVDGDYVNKKEPNVEAVAALYVPSSGVIDSLAFIKKLNQVVKTKGVQVFRGADVQSVEHRSCERIHYLTKDGTDYLDSEIVINSAGLYSDVVAKMINPETYHEIIPMKGESVKFLRNDRDVLYTNGMNIYPAPHGIYLETGDKADVPFTEFKELLEKDLLKKSVGVHITPLVFKQGREFVLSNEITVGPVLRIAKHKEDYTYSYGPDFYYNRLKGFFPGIRESDLNFNQIGILAMLKGHPDFKIEQDVKYTNCYNLVGIDSPGLTSCLAIAKHIKQMIL